jgi:hypothetical protein
MNVLRSTAMLTSILIWFFLNMCSMMPWAVDGVMWLRRTHLLVAYAKFHFRRRDSKFAFSLCGIEFFWILVARRGIIVVNLTQFLTRARSVHKYVCVYIYLLWVSSVWLIFAFSFADMRAQLLTTVIYSFMVSPHHTYDTLFAMMNMILFSLEKLHLRRRSLCRLITSRSYIHPASYLLFPHAIAGEIRVCARADFDLSPRAPGESPNRCSQSMHLAAKLAFWGFLIVKEHLLYNVIICGLDISPCVKFSYQPIFATAVFLYDSVSRFVSLLSKNHFRWCGLVEFLRNRCAHRRVPAAGWWDAPVRV